MGYRSVEVGGVKKPWFVLVVRGMVLKINTTKWYPTAHRCKMDGHNSDTKSSMSLKDRWRETNLLGHHVD